MRIISNAGRRCEIANERRVRDDYSFGLLSAPLAAGDVTINSANLANLQAIDTYSYCPLTINDPGSGNYEIVWVTAHAAGATSATIVRGREGTTAQAWGVGIGWLCAPTARDVALAGQPRAIFYDDCDSPTVPDGVVLTSVTAYTAATRSRDINANGIYQTPAFTYQGGALLIEADWTRITAGTVTLALRQVGQATNLGLYVSHQSDNNDVIYRNGSATGIASSGTTTYDKAGRFRDKIMGTSGGIWSAGIEYGERGVLLQGSYNGVWPAGGNIVTGTNYVVLMYVDAAATFRLHRLAVIA